MSAPNGAIRVGGRCLLDAGPSERGWHRVETFLRCPQLYAYKYLLGSLDAPVEGLEDSADPLERGAMGHIGMAHHYARLHASQRGEDPDAFHTPESAVALLGERKGWQRWIPLASAAVAAYAARYAMDRLEILDVEEVYSAWVGAGPGSPRYLYTQRADLAARFPDGKIRILDHKFLSRVDSASLKAYSVSGQFLGLAHFGRARWGDAFGGVLVNAIVVGGLDPTTGAGTTTFRRAAPPPAPWAAYCHPLAVKDAEEEIAKLAASGRSPWEYPKRLNEAICRGRYGFCGGHALCALGPTDEQRAQSSSQRRNP